MTKTGRAKAALLELRAPSAVKLKLLILLTGVCWGGLAYGQNVWPPLPEFEFFSIEEFVERWDSARARWAASGAKRRFDPTYIVHEGARRE